MSTVTEDGGRTNIYAKEPEMYYDRQGLSSPYEQKEMYNGRWAMIGMISLLVSYFSTGQIIPGIF